MAFGTVMRTVGNMVYKTGKIAVKTTYKTGKFVCKEVYKGGKYAVKGLANDFDINTQKFDSATNKVENIVSDSLDKIEDSAEKNSKLIEFGLGDYSLADSIARDQMDKLQRKHNLMIERDLEGSNYFNQAITHDRLNIANRYDLIDYIDYKNNYNICSVGYQYACIGYFNVLYTIINPNNFMARLRGLVINSSVPMYKHLKSSRVIIVDLNGNITYGEVSLNDDYTIIRGDIPNHIIYNSINNIESTYINTHIYLVCGDYLNISDSVDTIIMLSHNKIDNPIIFQYLILSYIISTSNGINNQDVMNYLNLLKERSERYTI